MEPGDQLLGSTARGYELLRSCGDELCGSKSRGYSCAGAAQSTTPFFNVTRVIALAPYEFHPYHSRERKYLPSWRYYRNNPASLCFFLETFSLVVSHLRT